MGDTLRTDVPLPKKKIGRTEFLRPIFISGRGDVCTQAIWVISAKKNVLQTDFGGK